MILDIVQVLCIIMDQDLVVVNKKKRKKKQANIQPSWPNKNGQ